MFKDTSLEAAARRYVSAQERYMASDAGLETTQSMYAAGELGRLGRLIVLGKTTVHALRSGILGVQMHDFQTNAMWADIPGVASTPLDAAYGVLARAEQSRSAISGS